MNITATTTLLKEGRVDASALYYVLSEGLQTERIKFQAEQALGHTHECNLIENRILHTERFLSLVRLAQLNGGG